MKKAVKIEFYLDCITECGAHCWNYVTTVWGDHIKFEGSRWYLCDSGNHLVCCGNVAELHGNGTDEFDTKFKNVVCY